MIPRLPVALAALSLVAACRAPGTRESAPDRPNVVVLFTDDQGYGDLSATGHPTIHTPHLDRLMGGGARLTQCYVPSPVCSPSRAALLTGCYPKRLGMHRHVVFPAYDYGLHSEEVTLADLLSDHGYATGCFGKWHLGHRPGLLPTDQGFDTYYGVPYSNDMAQMHRKPDNNYAFRLPLLRDDAVIEWEPDQRLFTRRCTEEAVAFLDAHADGPFFAYVPYSMPHIPLYASDEMSGRSPRGLYGDVIEEIDWSVGQIVAALERNGVFDDTLIFFASDNGPWLQFRLDGGSAGLLRGGKGTNWEGGQRVPGLVHWPARIPAGRVCREVVTTMDLFPTVAAVIGAAPSERTLDGHDVGALLWGAGDAPSPTDAFVYYEAHGDLAGIRRGPWKLLLKSGELYHLERDPGEKFDVAADEPVLVEELREAALALDARIAAEARPTQTVDELLFDPRKPGADG